MNATLPLEKIKCRLSKRYMAWDKIALRKQCHPFLAGQATEREKHSPRKPEDRQIICIEI